MISFEEATLDWFGCKEEGEPFKDWKELKERLLVRFHSSRKGSMCAIFGDQTRNDCGGILKFIR